MRRFAASAVVVFFLVLTATLAIGRTRGVRFPSETVGTSFGAPLKHLTPEQMQRFHAGSMEFANTRFVGNGLGPVFNSFACVNCHNRSGVGGGSGATVTRIGRLVGGKFDPMTSYGGSAIQSNALSSADVPHHPFEADRIPREATFVSDRKTPALFGLGLVDATPDATFIAMAQLQAIHSPDTAGRVNMVANLSTGAKSVGKFGWKAQNPTLLQFSGDAYVNELGVTNPQFPNENCPNGVCDELKYNPLPGLNDDGTAVRRSADFMTLLAPPPRDIMTPEVLEGEAVFHRIGCTACHVPTLTTGPSDVFALDRKDYHPYSDFLLHDMGSLGDGIEQEEAKGNEFRTPPLWGIRAFRSFLHDGRVRTAEEAIEQHDGQGRGARDRFRALTPEERKKLMAFVMSL